MAIITISRMNWSYGAELAEAVANNLGYSCLSREVLIEGAKQFNILEETLLDDLQNPPSAWKRWKNEKNRYPIYIQCALLRKVREDNIVYHGHAGQLFLDFLPSVLRLRVIAPMELRIKKVMEELQVSADDAIKVIEKSDKTRQRWIKFLYDREFHDDDLYDLTLNFNRIDLDSAADMVCQLVRRDVFKSSPGTLQRLADKSLECEIRAALASDDKLWNQPLEVSVLNGFAQVRGTVKNAKQREMVEQLVPMVKGVKELRITVNLASDSMTGVHKSIPRD